MNSYLVVYMVGTDKICNTSVSFQHNPPTIDDIRDVEHKLNMRHCDDTIIINYLKLGVEDNDI